MQTAIPKKRTTAVLFRRTQEFLFAAEPLPPGVIQVIEVALLLLHQLLPAINVVRSTRQRCVRHQMYSQRRNIRRPDYPPDRQNRSQLLAPRVQLIAEKPSR